MREEIERRIVELVGRNAELGRQELVAERPAVEDELDVERRAKALLDLGKRFVREAAGFERRGVDCRRLGERGVADRIDFHLGDLACAIAKRAQRFRHRLVDDLEVAAARELLEFDESEVGLDAGRVAVHHEADRAGRRDDGCLRVAIAVLLAKLKSAHPRRASRLHRGDSP